MTTDAATPATRMITKTRREYPANKARAIRKGVCIDCPAGIEPNTGLRCVNCKERINRNRKQWLERKVSMPCSICGKPNRLDCSMRCQSLMVWRTDEIKKLAERFWKYVDTTPGQGPKGDCWGWKGARNGKYGHIGGGLAFNYRPIGAHVASYIIHFGPILGGLHVLHNCDNHICPNPDHLRTGTDADNGHDRVLRGALVEEISIHSLKPDALIVSPEEIELQIDRPKIEHLLESALAKLTDTERQVIIWRFGLYGEPVRTLAVIGVELKRTHEGIRFIESKAIERLKHPAVSKELRAALAA